MAKHTGARVIGTGSESSFEFLRELGAEPVAYGEGLADRVRELAPDGLTAATSLVGLETVEVALAVGVPPKRISTIAAGPNPPGGVLATGGSDAPPDALDRIAAAIAAGELVVPIAATFPLDQIRKAVELQRGGHTHGKIVVTLKSRSTASFPMPPMPGAIGSAYDADLRVHAPHVELPGL
jgi:NADPH:quinone reductase-like Zn-dependent oxidoreductase